MTNRQFLYSAKGGMPSNLARACNDSAREANGINFRILFPSGSLSGNVPFGTIEAEQYDLTSETGYVWNLYITM